MENLAANNRFTCPHCKGKSKLPEPVPIEGLYKISCALCQNQSLIRFKGSHAKVEEVLPATKPLPTKKDYKPFFEKKTLSEDFRPDPNFRSLKERLLSINNTNEPTWDPRKHWNKLTGYFRTSHQSRNFKKSISQNRKRSNHLSLFYWTVIASLLFTITVFTYLGVGVLQAKSELNSILAGLSKGKPTKILDRNGQVVSEIFQKRISTLKLSDYPENLVTALLNVEDRSFYSHGGIDFTALIRAMVQNIIHLRYKQGASTITQQLARVLLDDRRKSLGRKWKELELALALEAYLSKDEILEYYMNNVYLGHGAFGFGEAIKFYFNKNPTELNRTEAVLLATLPSAPNRNSPLKNPHSSKTRLDYILQAFKNRGVIKDIPDEEIATIYSDFSTRSPNETVFGNRQDLAPYVTEHIRSLLKSIEQGDDIYDEGGFIVETTLIKEVQESLGSIVHKHLQKIQKNGQVRRTLLRKAVVREPKEVLAIRSLIRDSSLAMGVFSSSELNETGRTRVNGLQAAIIAIDPETGEVLFMHGGDEFKSNNQFNRSIQMRRQTGSSIKPILYAAAINSGKLTTADKILDAPLIYRGVQGMPNWMPDNISKTYDGEISPRYALTKSKNTAAVQIAEKLGYSQLDHYFSEFFFPDSKEKSKRFRNDLSLALGSLELSPIEMASAFSAFANEGKVKRPILVRRILNPEGKVIYQAKGNDEFNLKVPEERMVIKPDAAEVMLSLLKDSGRASGVYRSGYKGVIAGKTGTTNDYKDAWFLGLRPGISLAVWIGFDNPKYGMGSGGLGGGIAAPLWGEIINSAVKEKHIASKPFPKPVFAVSSTICGTHKSNCSDCLGPNQEWFTQDHVGPGNCTEVSSSPEGSREVLQELF